MDEDTESSMDITEQLFKLAFDNRIIKMIVLGYSLINSLIIIMLVALIVINLKERRV
mgnify:CR=1 FL=1